MTIQLIAESIGGHLKGEKAWLCQDSAIEWSLVGTEKPISVLFGINRLRN